MEWYQKAAAQGYADAQFNLGIMYDNGDGVVQDHGKAAEWYQKAANQGNALAQRNLGIMYANGEGVPQDYGKAVEWFQKAADQGDEDAQNTLEELKQYGMQGMVNQGNAQEQFEQGLKYEEGDGVAQNYQKAMECYQKAADQGLAEAQTNLGFMFEKGQGVAQNYQKALECYQNAANQGEAQAQYNLGCMYERGRGVAQNYQKAVEWYQKAANQGHSDAQTNLGFMYYSGYGVARDYQKAAEWFQKAADQGNEEARHNLDVLKQQGNYEKKTAGASVKRKFEKQDVIKQAGKGKTRAALVVLLVLRVWFGAASPLLQIGGMGIGLTALPTAVACMLFGPVKGMVFEAVACVLSCNVIGDSGYFLLGNLLTGAVAGLIYGIGFHKKEKLSLRTVAIVLAVVAVGVDILMTVVLRNVLYGGFDFEFAWILNMICQYLVNVAGVYVVLNALRKIPAINKAFGLTGEGKK